MEPSGEMLDSLWELVSTDLANVEDANLNVFVSGLVKQFALDEGGSPRDIAHPVRPHVVIGRDTR